MKNILVLGSSGFVGSHIKRQLKDDKNSVVFEINRGDDELYNQFQLARFIEKNSIDFIINCVGSIGVDKSFQEHCFTNVVLPTKFLNSMHLSTKSDICFINLSSAGEYGFSTDFFTEDHYCKPTNDYAKSKFVFSNILNKTNFLDSSKIINLRVFNLYGKGVTNTFAGNVISTLRSVVTTGRCNEVILSNALRDFVFIDDLVKFILAIINENYNFTNAYNLINFCTGKPLSFVEFFNLALDASFLNGLPFTVIDSQDNNIGCNKRLLDLGFTFSSSSYDCIKKWVNDELWI